MNILDDIEKIKKLDKSGVYQSIENLDKQCWDAWQKVQGIEIPGDYKNFSNIIVCGMGGSALGAHVIQSLYREELKVPLVIVRDYNLPGFINENSLVILSSYSGNTEETLSCAEEAIKKKARSFIITSNGKLKKLAKDFSLLNYVIDPLYNPCGQPRMAIGYSIFGQLALFARLGLIRLKEQEIKKTIRLIKLFQENYSIKVSLSKNQAKKIAEEIQKKIPILVAAEHLVGATHVFSNQLNENAKNFSDFLVIPELNHHLMEGLGHPKLNSQILKFLFINSKFYIKKNQQRFKLTEEVVNKNNIASMALEITEAKDKLQETFGLIALGSFVSFYTAMKHQIDPTPIPWVDYFKQSLKNINRTKL